MNEPTRLGRLGYLESIIAPGLQTFIQVGDALAEIRNDELWKDAHYKTWADYLDTRWKFGTSRARQLINGAQLTKHIESVTGVTLMNECQARKVRSVLRQYPEEIQAIALEGVSKHKDGITPERLAASCEALMEFAVTGYVSTEDGEQSAINSMIKQIRREQEIGKRPAPLLDTPAMMTRNYTQTDGLYITFKLPADTALDLQSYKPVRLVIQEAA